MSTIIIIDNTFSVILGIGILALLLIFVLSAAKYLSSAKSVKFEKSSADNRLDDCLNSYTDRTTSYNDPLAQFANRQEAVAAISAAIAAYSNNKIEGIRIVSIRKL